MLDTLIFAGLVATCVCLIYLCEVIEEFFPCVTGLTKSGGQNHSRANEN